MKVAAIVSHVLPQTGWLIAFTVTTRLIVSAQPVAVDSNRDQASGDWRKSVFDSNVESVVFINRSATLKNGIKDNVNGTGFIVSSRGYVITCAHIVPQPSDGETMISVKASVGREEQNYKLTEVQRKPDLDLVLLKLPYRPSAPWHSVQSINEPEMLADILAMGYPENENVSAVPGTITNTDAAGGRLTTNAAVNPGMSGAPVFDRTGGVVAIVVSGKPQAQLISELIPIDYARDFLQMSGSPALTKQNQAVQRTSKEVAKIADKLLNSQAALEAQQLNPDQSAEVKRLVENATESKATWNSLQAKYLEVSRTKPGPNADAERQAIINDMTRTVKTYDAAAKQLTAFAPPTF
jgi:S1-C subfamily serine protease